MKTYNEVFNTNYSVNYFNTYNFNGIKNINYFINSKLQNYLIYIMQNIILDKNYTYYDMDYIPNRSFLQNSKSNCHPDLYIKTDNDNIKFIEVKTIVNNNYNFTSDIIQDSYDFITNNLNNKIDKYNMFYVFIGCDTPEFEKNSIRKLCIIDLPTLAENYVISRNFDKPGSYLNNCILNNDLFNSCRNKKVMKRVIDEINEFDFNKIKKDIIKNIGI